MRQRLVALTAVTLLAATALHAEPARRSVRNTLGAMVNIVGIEDILDVEWRWPLSSSSNPLLKDAHFSAGLTNTFSPAYDRVGAWAEVSPLSVLDLRAGVEPTLYFGLFNSLQDFGSYDALFDEKTRKETNDLSYLGFANRLYLAPTLKMKAGPIVAFGGAEIDWWRAQGDGPYFYEPGRDILLKTDGSRLIRSNVGLLLERSREGGGKLLVGPFHNMIDVEGARQNRLQRIGVMAVNETSGRHIGLNAPTFIVQAAYYLNDRFKRHELWALAAVRVTFGAR